MFFSAQGTNADSHSPFHVYCSAMRSVRVSSGLVSVLLVLTVVSSGVIMGASPVRASNSVSDVSWSTSDTAQVYDIDEQDVRSIDIVTLTQNGEYEILLRSDNQGEYPWKPWLSAYDTNLKFQMKIDETNLKQRDSDNVAVRYGVVDNDLSPAYLNSVGFQSFFVSSGDTLNTRKENLNPRVYQSRNFIYYAVKLEDAEFGGFFGDNDRTTINNIRVTQSHEGQNVGETYSFSVSSKQAQSTTGSATLSFNHEPQPAMRSQIRYRSISTGTLCTVIHLSQGT